MSKRFTLEETDWSYRIRDNGAIMKIPKIVDLLNEQHETITRQYTDLGKQTDIHRAYKQQVQETLQKRYAQLDRITKRYGDMHKPCKDLLAEICNELGVEIDD